MEESIGPVVVYQVPFCSPFLTPRINLSGAYEHETLWSQLSSVCRSANIAAACVVCMVAFCCMLIHIATMVAYSKLRGDILQRKTTSSGHRAERRKNVDLRVMKEAANYAFAMTTQERLRMTLAFTGLFSSTALLPLTVASAGIAYSLPYPKSAMETEQTWVTMRPFSIAVTALYHLTLIASLCILLLMAIERCREIGKIHPDRYITSGRDEYGQPYRRSMLDAERQSTKNQPINRRNDPDVIPRRDDMKFGRLPDTFLHTFNKSYTFLDLVMALVVPLASGIITTIAVALFGSRFESYGIISRVMHGRSYSINGLFSYRTNSYPSNVYMYAFTIGVMIVACIILNLISFFKCKTLIGIAKYLPGYRHSQDLFKYGGSKEEKVDKPARMISRHVELSPIKVVKVMRYPKVHRQDPEGLSADEPDCLDSSMSSIPPPPVPLSSMPAASLDNLSLPPPPRPESMADPAERLLISYPSLPSMTKAEEEVVQDPSDDDDITGVRAETFFGNIRQSKVVIVVFVLFLILSAPSMALFAMGAFYSHDDVVTRFMGFTNTTLVRLTTPSSDLLVTKSDVISPTVTTLTSAEGYQEVATQSMITETSSAVRNNWVTTLSGLFMVLYAIASMAPFFVYCAASRNFRLEASRFFCSCLCRCLSFKHRSENNRDITRSNTSRYVPKHSVKHSNSFRFSGNLGRATPVKLINVQKRRDKPGARQGTRNATWEQSDQYGTARL